MRSTIGSFDRAKSNIATARRTQPLPMVVFATLALALLIAGCITPSDPRLDDSDVDGHWSMAGAPRIALGHEQTVAPSKVMYRQ